MSALVWPYPTRNDGQWRRIDQGQDLQVPVGTPILAVGAGYIEYGHNLKGFGDPYPIINLDAPVASNGRWYHAVYYGHNHPDLPAGARVAQGDVIAHALATPGGNAWGDPGWLELGFYPQMPGTGWTQAGQDMHDLLKTAPLWGSEDGENAMAFSSEAEKQLDANNAKWAYEDQGFLKQAMAEMEARVNRRLDQIAKAVGASS